MNCEILKLFTLELFFLIREDSCLQLLHFYFYFNKISLVLIFHLIIFIQHIFPFLPKRVQGFSMKIVFFSKIKINLCINRKQNFREFNKTKIP